MASLVWPPPHRQRNIAVGPWRHLVTELVALQFEASLLLRALPVGEGGALDAERQHVALVVDADGTVVRARAQNGRFEFGGRALGLVGGGETRALRLEYLQRVVALAVDQQTADRRGAIVVATAAVRVQHVGGDQRPAAGQRRVHVGGLRGGAGYPGRGVQQQQRGAGAGTAIEWVHGVLQGETGGMPHRRQDSACAR